MRKVSTAWAVLLVTIRLLCCCTAAPAQVTWNVDNTTNIGGNAVTTIVGSPTVVSTPFGDGLKFDGNDGVIVNANPIAGAANFTIEMLFRPDPIVNAASFSHACSSFNRCRILPITGPRWKLESKRIINNGTSIRFSDRRAQGRRIRL